MNSNELASKIDHTLLRPDASLENINSICREAIENQFAAVCIPPCFVNSAADLLKGTAVKLATVIGFPMGYSTTAVKISEAEKALSDGADELDVVINLALFVSGNESVVSSEIQSICNLAHRHGKIVKWIIETGLLNETQIVKCCEIAVNAGVDYVKTSTGINGTGATVDIIKLLRKSLPAAIRIKASGGIKSLDQAVALIHAGADRIGTSSSLLITGKAMFR